jgi:3-hydroxyisobutyrate dehydrogenase-like beta-hydroxyacid dehydrogenase
VNIGFVGTGSIGTPMAMRLLAVADTLFVYDVRAEATAPVVAQGASPAQSPRDVADRADAVALSLPTREAFLEATLGADGVVRGKRAQYILNTSTMGLPCVRDVAAQLATRGVQLVDCPISGGVRGAREGSLSVMVSGDPGAVAAVRPILERWGTITVAGEAPGAAQALKLTNNILSIVALVATSEALVMGAKAGLDPEVMLSAINAGTGRNSATTTKFPVSVLDRSFRFGSTIQILMKDADLAIEQGEALGVPMWVCNAARLVYKHAVFQGAAQDDVTTIVQHIERAAGFELPRTR